MRAAGIHSARHMMVMLVMLVMLVLAGLARSLATSTGDGSGNTMTVAASPLGFWRHLSLVHIDCVAVSARD